MVYIILAILGLAFGSFINALVWRMHHAQQVRIKPKSQKKRRTAREADNHTSVWRGRSVCSHCQHSLAAADLIPVISWLYLRGRCRYCHEPITDSPLAELLLPVLLIVSYVAWPLELGGLGWLQFGIWSLLLVILVALLIYDIRWMLLPNKLVFWFSLLAGTITISRIPEAGMGIALSALLGVMSVAGIFFSLYYLSRGRWIGFGDVKLGVGIGLLVANPLHGLMVIFLASIMGSVVAIPQMIKGKLGVRSKLPFGPFLLLAAWCVFLFSDVIMAWYLNLIHIGVN